MKVADSMKKRIMILILIAANMFLLGGCTLTIVAPITGTVSNSMKVELSGSGSVRYIGSPTISQDISGSGTVEKISD